MGRHYRQPADGFKPLILFEKSRQEMFDVNLLMAQADSTRLRGLERLLSLFGEPIDVHTLVHSYQVL